MATFSTVLAALLRTDPGRPLVTFYDDATGERVELSVTTYANWVAKTAGLAQDELDVGLGGRLLLDLPTHWLGAVWVGAALSLGLVVDDDPAQVDRADLVVCGPEGLQRYAALAAAADVPVVALSLAPMAGRFTAPLPPGVTDFAAVVLGQPDTFVAHEPPGPTDPAWAASADGLAVTQEELLARSGADPVVAPGGRLLTDANPGRRDGVVTLLATVVQGASTVWVAHPDPERWTDRGTQELATHERRDQGR